MFVSVKFYLLKTLNDGVLKGEWRKKGTIAFKCEKFERNHLVVDDGKQLTEVGQKARTQTMILVVVFPGGNSIRWDKWVVQFEGDKLRGPVAKQSAK